MLHSIATVCLSGTLPQKLEAAAAARFDAVEIFESDLTYFEGSPGDVRELAGDLGLEIALFQPFRDFEGAPRERRQRNLDRAERKFDLMAELGTNRLLLCSNVAPDTIADDEAAVDDLGRLAERAGHRGIIVGYEALAWGRHVRTWAHAWRIVEAVGQPSLGLIVDSFHTLSLGDDPSGLAQVPGERIVFVQVADAPRLQMDVLSWSRHFRCFPGQGDLDVAGFLAAVLASGYGGPVSLEVFNDEFRAASTRQTARGRPAGPAVPRGADAGADGGGRGPGGAARGALRRPVRAAAAQRLRGAGVRRVRGRRQRRRPAGMLARAPGLRGGRAAPLEGRDPLPAGRGQPRGQRRARVAGPRLLPGARALGVRAGLPPRTTPPRRSTAPASTAASPTRAGSARTRS